MSKKITKRLSLRKSFARAKSVQEIPNLIDTQVDSHKKFLQTDFEPDSREDIGLQAVFKSVFPIKDYNDTASLEFVSYELGDPKYDVDECHERGMTWSAPLKVTVQLVLFDVDEEGEKQIRDIKEQQVYFGEMPLMTEKGTFMINGTERVVVSQLHRSPGVFFSHDKGKTPSGKLLYEARIIPYRGSWLDFEFDVKDILHVRIDRKRKQNASIILRALGLSTEEILHEYHKVDKIKFTKAGIVRDLVPELFDGFRAIKDIKSPGDSKVIVKSGQKFNRAVLRKLLEAEVKEIPVEANYFDGVPIAKTIVVANRDVVNPKTNRVAIKEGDVCVGWKELHKKIPDSLKGLGEEQTAEFFEGLDVVCAAGELVQPDLIDSKGRIKTPGTLQRLRDLGIEELELLYTRENHIGDSLIKTVLGDGLEPERDDLVSHYMGFPCKDALIEIYKRIRPGDPPRLETAQTNFNNLFFNPERYDLSPGGRLKLDFKLHGEGRTADKKTGNVRKTVDKESGSTFTDRGVLTKGDIIESVRYLLELRAASDPLKYATDDIDHLGNRRIRSVGELIENQYRVGLVRMERAIKERMSIQDIETLMPQDLINYKPVSAIVNEFYGSSPLSQFMDQTNPISEVTHKRRLSALGPGGLTRERAGFEVRDVHPTHYGRVCPIETPEGPNIGLISSLATYARVNAFGFVESPYRLVKSGKVTDDVVYLSAMQEEREVIAQANADVDDKSKFSHDYISARKNNDFVKVASEQVTLMDVSPSQLVSVAASLIPFLEHDDANRALMGSNMQRQAVPLLKSSAPLVGTGMERIVARDSGATVVTGRAGVVDHVDANRIIVKADKWTGDPLDTGVDIYNMNKYQRSNQNTCINQRPIVRVGDKIDGGEVIADGQSTDKGELALGKNVLIAFMPWGGYNFEDSILVSEELVKEDVFTSIHIEEFECVARDTKLGNEEITRDIPNVGEDALRNLDESGIISIGSEVKQSDILVGKVTPKSETQLSPEEKLLRAIFGEKAGEVRDTSMRLPPGVEGTVIAAHVFSRKGTSKDERMLEIEKAEIARLEKDQRDEIRILRESALKQLSSLLSGKLTSTRLVDEGRKQLLAKGTEISKELLSSIPFEYLRDLKIGNEKVEEEVDRIVVGTGQLINNKRGQISAKISRLKQGDELPPGVIKMVKIFVAVKRRLSVGDKMAGRHGNKGVLSRILPVEDMPYLPDGTPVHMVLNPLGVPSRMNIGQVLETHLGWANFSLGQRVCNLIQQVADVKTRFGDRLRSSSDQTQLNEVSSELSEIYKTLYKDTQTEKLVDSLDKVEVLELGQKDVTGVRVASPVFEGVTEEELKNLLKLAQVEETAQTALYDGRTGEKFSEPVTVGVMYMLKLHHLVDDKIHARSIGPYSLVTQQPLGGKAQFGGQRLGEMEVWALEAYGAAFALQEFLTVKSDDVAGRTRMYESIVKGENVLEPGLPESFNVMCKELKSLGLKVDLVEKEQASSELSGEDNDPISAELARLAAGEGDTPVPTANA